MAKQAQLIEELQNIINNLDQPEHGRATESSIQAAERLLGVKFCPSYRHYLREHGLYDDNGRDVYGRSPDYHSDVVNSTEFFKELESKGQAVFLPSQNPGLVSIGSAWEGTAWFFLDTIHVDEKGEGPVLMQGHGVPLQQFAPNFVAFLRRMVEEESPFKGVLKDPPRPRPESEPESEDNRVNRSIVWMGVDPDPAAPPGPPNARFFGLDTDSRDVFVHAKGAGLDLMQQLAASEANAFFFANPSDRGTTGEPFVAIDYILEHHPKIETADQLREIRAAVHAAYDQAQAADRD